MVASADVPRVGLSPFLAAEDDAPSSTASNGATRAVLEAGVLGAEGGPPPQRLPPRDSVSRTAAPTTPRPRPVPARELRFVEVKLRDPDDPLADEALTPSKRTRLRACARAWLDAHPDVLGAELAFLVAVVPPEALKPGVVVGRRDIVWLDDAFDG